MNELRRGAPLKPVVVCLAALSVLGCDRTLAPQRNRLTDLRQQGTQGVGVFNGRVRVLDPSQPCHRSTEGVAGMRVELGLWDGIPAFYRDTMTRQVPATLEEPRFQFLAATTTDSEGRFTFAEVPNGFPYAMRVVPPKNSPWKIGYGGTLYGPPRGREQVPEYARRLLQDFPILCVEPR